MKKLLILLFSILISLNSFGDEIKSLFGITLYDNAEKHVSSNYIDSNKYSGLAFGLGIERIAMLKHGVTDIREFYKSNLDFLSQFK